jgi:replicative DNA helicase
LEGIEKQDEIEFITDSFEDLAKSVHRNAGIKWRLPSLQEALGSLNKGDFGFIFARPETGKTTFLASEISHFVEQVEGPIIWFNNEERGDKVKTRVCQANLGLSLEEMFSNLLENEKIYLTNTKSLVKIYDKGFIHKREVEKVVKQLNPSLVVFDQIDKIKGFKGDREDLKLGAIYMWARELAKDYCPVIGVCQAAASAENKRWLDMDDVAKSKTEKAAEADFIIGIGKRHDVGSEDVRFLHLIKNKLTGIHARITCNIDARIARYTDIE